jgi:hypothetical protein
MKESERPLITGKHSFLLILKLLGLESLGEDRFIRLFKPVKKKKDTLLYYLDYSKNLQEYLFSNHFYVKYEKNVNLLENGVLNIPGISCLFTFALITGTDLFVEELDELYYYSLKEFEKILIKIFPDLSFTGRLIVNKLVQINQKNQNSAVMFSGGVDSTHLYTKMRRIKPELYTIIGGTIPVTNKNLIHKFKANIEYFSERERVNVNFIETNIGKVLNEGLLTARYGANFPQPDPTWWGKVNHGIVQLSVCAPLTFMDEVNSIYMATSSALYPDGAHPVILKNIFWNGTQVFPDIDNNKRFDKIKKVYESYSRHDPSLPKFQVCNYSPANSNLLNCGSCDKCLSTIVSLMVLGLDPRRNGFPIIKNIYKRLQKHVVPKTNAPHQWGRIQDEAKKTNYKLLYSSKDFFQWFKEFQFKTGTNKKLYGQRVKCRIMKVTTRLPKHIQDIIMEKYYQVKYLKKISSSDIDDLTSLQEE